MRTLPSLLGAGAFGAFIAILPSLDSKLVVLACSGATSAVIGLYISRSLSENAKQPVGTALIFLGGIMAAIAFSVLVIVPTLLRLQ